MFRKLVKLLLRPKWVVFRNECPEAREELGLQIWGVIFALYKADVYNPTNILQTRQPMKREFGESLYARS